MTAVTAAPETPPPPPAAPTPQPAPPKGGSKKRAARRRRAARGTTRVDRVNRMVLLLLAVAAVALGIVALVGPGRRPGDLYADAASSIVDEPDLALGITLAVCAVVLVLALWWAWSQVSPRSGDGRIRTTTIARTPHGVTTIEPAAAASALARDLETVPGVEGARVRIVALGRVPDLIATIDLRRDVDLAAVRRAIEEPLDRFAASTNATALEAEVRLRITNHRAGRVV